MTDDIKQLYIMMFSNDALRRYNIAEVGPMEDGTFILMTSGGKHCRYFYILEDEILAR